MNQTKQNVQGIHDNLVSGSHPPSTVTLTSQWIAQNTYHVHTYPDKGEGQAGNKSKERTIRQD